MSVRNIYYRVLVAVSVAGAAMALALLATIIVSMFTVGEEPIAEFFRPETLEAFRKWSGVALQWFVPIVLLPTVAIFPLLAVIENWGDRKSIWAVAGVVFTLAVCGAAAYGILQLRDVLAEAMPPDGTPFFQRLAFLPKRLLTNDVLNDWTNEIAAATGVSPKNVPWMLPVAVAIVCIVGVMKMKLFSESAKRYSYFMVLTGIFLSLAASAYSFGFLLRAVGNTKARLAPFALSETWGETVPQIFFALLLMAIAVFFAGMVCESVSARRSLIGKFFGFVIGISTGAVMSLCGILFFLIGCYIVPLTLMAIGIAVAVIGGIIVTSILLKGWVSAESSAGASSGGGWSGSSGSSSSSGSGSTRTIITDSNGTDYIGSGSDPSTIEKQTPGDYAVFDRQYDGSYKERWGDRTLEN